jgi:hypothetical protein
MANHKSFSLSPEAKHLASEAGRSLTGKTEPDWRSNVAKEHAKMWVYDWKPCHQALADQIIKKDLVCMTLGTLKIVELTD